MIIKIVSNGKRSFSTTALVLFEVGFSPSGWTIKESQLKLLDQLNNNEFPR